MAPPGVGDLVPDSAAFYRTIRLLFRVLARPLFGFRVHGAERVPRTGPGVIVAPHRSWLDPACVGAACPRPVRFLIMEKVYRLRGAGWFFRAMGSLPVRPGGFAALGSLRRALRVLERGQLVGVFPEGRVFSEARPGPVHPGAALLAVRVAAPVIPMVIRGSARAWPHGRRWPAPARVSVHIGEPIQPPRRGPGAVDELVRRIGHELGGLSRREPAR